MKINRTQLPWMKTVKVGDVLISSKGTFRVVRGVTRFSDGDLRCVDFAIRHCSWTGRPVTVVNFTDLRSNGYYPAGIRVRLESELDKKLAEEVKCIGLPQLSCCRVKGIA